MNSDASSSTLSSVNEKDLLNFYKKKYEEFQRKEDKYKEKVDRHLKNLIADRGELEKESLRRSEKIADLQKAVVDLQFCVFDEREKFLKVSSENAELQRNEEKLRDRIRQLLATTDQQDLRDKIIYILEEPEPKVEIHRTYSSVKSRSAPEVTVHQKLKEKLDNLERELNEALTVSKNKSDIVLEDCKQALESSKKKIIQDEIQIKELLKKLQELKTLEKNKSSVASAKGSFVENQRSVPISKSVSAENHLSLTAAKDISQQTSRTITAVKNLCVEKKSSQAVEKGASREKLSSAAATKSISADRVKKAKAASAISWENEWDATATKSISEETQQYATVTKGISGETQRYATATKTISGEFHPAVQSSIESEVLTKLCSLLKDIHLSLILLTKVISKVKTILNSIQATKLYHRTAKIPRTPSDLHFSINQDDVQLESCLRQCTRLAFDVNNMYKGLCKHVTLNKSKIQNIKSELKHLEKLVGEMSWLTTENDLSTVALKRSHFFQALENSSVVLPEERRLDCLEKFKKIVSNCETLSKTVSEAVEFVESVLEKYTVKRDFYDIANSLRDFSYLSSEAHSAILQDQLVSKSASDEPLKQFKMSTDLQSKSQSLQDLEQLVDIYKRTAQDSEKLGLSTEKLTTRIRAAERILQAEDLKKCDDNFDEMIMDNTYEAYSPTSDHDEIVKNINKTLSKIELLKKGKYWKDEEMCRKLVENVNALTEQFKELNQEFNVKSVQDHFSEYSKVTLSKLEELAKQCRNSVIAAEAQIAAHRSNAKDLSERLKETEELLCESINECLSLKQKNNQKEAEYEMEKFTLISSLKQKLEQNTLQEVDKVIDELVSNFPAYETIKSTPYICMYCRHGPGHKHCEEKIKELAAECRKFKTQLKLLKKETDQERLTLKNHRELAESSVTDLTKTNLNMKSTLQALEKKNASLLEQVKLERNRLKNMERFRRLEIEGFQTDIKQLKDKIKDLEKQLLKAVLIFENNHKDIEMLKTVHETAHRSEQAVAMIKRLKAKLYQLENDIKSL